MPPRPLLRTLLLATLFAACSSPPEPATTNEPTELEHAATPLPRPDDLPALHAAVLDGNVERIAELRTSGTSGEQLFAGWTALDLAFAAWEHASEGGAPSDVYTAEQKALLEATNLDTAQLDRALTALIDPLPADAESTKLVEAWFAAAATGNAQAAMALGTPAWVQEERTWKPSFSRAVFQNGVRFAAYEITGAEQDGNLLRPDGTTDGEGMAFKLQAFNKELKIVELR